MDTAPIGASSLSRQALDVIRGTAVRENPEIVRKLKRVPQAEQARVAEVLIAGDAKSVAEAQRVLRGRAKLGAIAAAAALAPKLTPDAWEVVEGDCVGVMRDVPDESVRLIFADPPYNIGVDYGTGAAADQLDDAAYLAWCEQWMTRCAQLLTPDGAMWVLINDEYAAEYVVFLKRKLRLHQRGWVKWYETFGVNCTDNFNRTSRHLLYFTRSRERFVFHPPKRPPGPLQRRSGRGGREDVGRRVGDPTPRRHGRRAPARVPHAAAPGARQLDRRRVQ